MDKIAQYIKERAKAVDFWSFLSIHEKHEVIGFRKGIFEPIDSSDDLGVLICVMNSGGLGYASTQDLSENGIKKAVDIACDWADKFSQYSLMAGKKNPFEANIGSYSSENQRPMLKVSLEEKINLLKKADETLREEKAIVDCSASLWSIDTVSHYQNSLGANVQQELNRVVPSLSATAYKNGISQVRTLGGMRAYCQQGGFEAITKLDLCTKAHEVAHEAVLLTSAINCPSATMDTVIAPDQMMLQIHESIGHPLELDRILGDERNYAGTSFVTLDMFGKYQYGSKLLNITFDPTIKQEFASYAYDDEGTKANKEFLIKDGLLIRPLGGAVAQARANMPGVANARVCSWNRPPIDRMANLNLEPGTSTFDEIISSVERGIYLKSNSSWSIDDSRNKFQFGCELGQLIENGKLTKLVRNPNYRGVSANFWRNLHMVGDAKTNMVMGTPYCGKGEPNQCIRVGHASPVCLFKNIDVFGGE